MTVQLSTPDFQRLTRIVQNLPDFANVRDAPAGSASIADRQRLIAGILEGVRQAHIILARLDLDGSPMGVSVEVVRFLSQFGRVAYDREALAVFLSKIQDFTGDEDKDFIVELFQNYPLDVPASPSQLTHYDL